MITSLKMDPKDKESTCKCEEEEDLGGYCDHCSRSFDNLSHFIRHVTHSKACKASYDPKVIEDYKRISRLRSRRKWYHEAAHGIRAQHYKEEREERRKKNKKVYYIPSSIKHSSSGLAFERAFKVIYQKFEEDARIQLQKQADAMYSLQEKAVDDALDIAFDHASAAVSVAIIHKDLETEEEIFEEAFAFMQRDFDKKLAEFIPKCKEEWSHKKFREITHCLLPSALNKAFLQCYENCKFEDLFKQAEENALDIVFEKLIVTEGYFDQIKIWFIHTRTFEENLEPCLVSSFHSVRQTEIARLAEESEELQLGFGNLLKSVMEEKFKLHDVIYERSE